MTFTAAGIQWNVYCPASSPWHKKRQTNVTGKEARKERRKEGRMNEIYTKWNTAEHVKQENSGIFPYQWNVNNEWQTLNRKEKQEQKQ